MSYFYKGSNECIIILPIQYILHELPLLSVNAKIETSVINVGLLQLHVKLNRIEIKIFKTEKVIMLYFYKGTDGYIDLTSNLHFFMN